MQSPRLSHRVATAAKSVTRALRKPGANVRKGSIPVCSGTVLLDLWVEDLTFALHFGALGEGTCILDINTEVANRALDPIARGQ